MGSLTILATAVRALSVSKLDIEGFNICNWSAPTRQTCPTPWTRRALAQGALRGLSEHTSPKKIWVAKYWQMNFLASIDQSVLVR
jgi:hypothetical protein